MFVTGVQRLETQCIGNGMAARSMIRELDAGLLAGVVLTAAGGWQILKGRHKESEPDEKQSTNNIFGSPRTQIESALFDAAATGPHALL